MSQFGTSVINKSGKKLAPKAPPRRRPGLPASTQASAKANIERQSQSQTPQPASSRPPQSSSPGPTSSAAWNTQTEPPVANVPRSSVANDHIHPDHLPEQPNPSIGPPIEQAPVASSRVNESQATPTSSQRNDLSVTAPHPNPSVPSRQAALSQAVQDISLAPAGEGGKRLESSLLENEGQEDTTNNGDCSLDAADGISTQRAAKRRRLDSTQEAHLRTKTGNSRPVTTFEASNNANETARSQGIAESSAGSKKKKDKTATKGKGKEKEGKAKAKHPLATAAEKAARNAARDAAKQSDIGGRRRRGRQRQVTPEHAETVEIAPTIVKMGDLCKDLRTGKKSKREAELQKIDYNKVVKEQQERMRMIAAGALPPPETVDQRLERVEMEQQSRRLAAPQMRMVNGHIVLDESSLRVDRHAQAVVETEPLEEVEENEFTSVFTSGKLSKRKKGESWTEELTDLFYKGLRMFGTDFGIIANMFPGRTRRQIKLKFCREERQDPQRINETLLGPREPVDIAEFSNMSNTVYEDPNAFTRELEAEAKQHEADQARQKAELAEMLSRRVAETVAEGDGPNENSSAKENEVQGSAGATVGKKGKKGAVPKKKKGKGRNVGGEDVEVLGMIEDFA
ncbi:MAG: Transcription factor TFIIIB component B [Candelina mexicana]|nr:MAG: Transcription factor TFIIIB component B [Candelina mexicana]